MDTITCPKCGSENRADAVNCKECRTNLERGIEDPEDVNAIMEGQQVQERTQESSLNSEENSIFGFNKEGISRILGEIRLNIFRVTLILVFTGVLGAIINYEKSFIYPFGIPFPIFCIITGCILFGITAVITVGEAIVFLLLSLE